MVNWWSGRYSTRVHLFCLVAAVVEPLTAFAGLVIYRYAIAEQARVEQEAVRIAAQTALLVEAELRQLTARLEGLTSSTALGDDDLERLHTEASRLTQGREETIILLSPDDRLRLVTLLLRTIQIPMPVVARRVALLPGKLDDRLALLLAVRESGHNKSALCLFHDLNLDRLPRHRRYNADATFQQLGSPGGRTEAPALRCAALPWPTVTPVESFGSAPGPCTFRSALLPLCWAA